MKKFQINLKKIRHQAMYLSLLMLAMAFVSCQKEHDDPPKIDEDQTLTMASSTAKLVEYTSANDGSYDNIVDGSSCFSVRFPYTVEVNGLELTINSMKDLRIIEEIFDALEDDENILEIIFPITITLADYTEVTLNGPEDLRSMAEECIEGGDDDDIECIDFVYPITLYSFDTNAEQRGSVTVESDMELRRFFAGLAEDDLVSIDFPISLITYEGVEIRVEDNEALAAALENARELCDEDDDDDYNDDDFTQMRLNNLLVECPWLIEAMHRDAIDHSDQYREYLMNFTEDGGVTMTGASGGMVEGTWQTQVSDYRVMLVLEFETMVDFNLEWYVWELEPNKIKLFSGEGNKVIMEGACDITQNEPGTLREILAECAWIIKDVEIQGEEVRRLLGYEFEFMAEGVVILSNGDQQMEGTWAVEQNAQGRLVLAIDINDEPGVSFVWPLTDLRDDRLQFEIPGTDSAMILQRVCDNSEDGDIVEISNIMIGGSWVVALYEENEDPNTSTFAGFTFDFHENDVLTVTVGDSGAAMVGSWKVLRNSEGQLKVYLNLGEVDPLGELTDDWDFVTASENRLELTDISGGDGSVTQLVFETY